MDMENIAKAILKVTEWIKWLEKDTTVWSWKSSYSGVSEKMVKWAIKKLMVENGLSIMPTSVEANTKVERWEEVDTWSKEVPKAIKSKQSVFTEVTTKYLLLHTSWQSIELAGYGQWTDPWDKGAGKATTYALKNTLMNTFMMITWEDTDNTHSQDIEIPKEKPWFNQPEFVNFLKVKDNYKTGDEAIEFIMSKYRINRSMQDSVRLEYVTK